MIAVRFALSRKEKCCNIFLARFHLSIEFLIVLFFALMFTVQRYIKNSIPCKTKYQKFLKYFWS